MDTNDAARDVAERAASVLGPESGLFEDLDAAGFGDALLRAISATMSNPLDATRAAVQLANDLARIPVVAGAKAVGADLEPPVPVDPKDRRFSDLAWSENPLFYGTRLTYLAACKWARDVIAAAPVAPDVGRKAGMFVDLMLDALAPTNFLPSNPAALKRAFDTGGSSLVAGARQFLDDARTNGGRPRQVDTSGFEVGRNLAVRPPRWCSATT